MEDGEIEVADHVVVLCPNSDSSSNLQAPVLSDSFLDDLMRNSQTCTHTHTCNPPGPDASAHTHTCYHTHTRLIPSEDDINTVNEQRSPASKPRGNREAVRKYREKKKAHAAYLEEEVNKLRQMNQVLMGKLQRQTILETEALRLRSLLHDLTGKIDDELADFSFQSQCTSMNSFKEGECKKKKCLQESLVSSLPQDG